jgi:hypothetical protein
MLALKGLVPAAIAFLVGEDIYALEAGDWTDAKHLGLHFAAFVASGVLIAIFTWIVRRASEHFWQFLRAAFAITVYLLFFSLVCAIIVCYFKVFFDFVLSPWQGWIMEPIINRVKGQVPLPILLSLILTLASPMSLFIWMLGKIQERIGHSTFGNRAGQYIDNFLGKLADL